MNQQELLQFYNDPRVRAVLGVIRDAEGTSRYGDPYRVAGGGGVTLSSLDTPTFHLWNFKDKAGKANKSSATGAYQFIGKTWNGLQQNYGFTDFSPRTQDLAAIALLKDAGALPFIQRGDYFGALNAAKKIWASLPGAGYNQQERGYDFLKKSLEKHLGAPVAMHEQSRPMNQPQQPRYQAVAQGDISPQIIDPYAKLWGVDQDTIADPQDEQQFSAQLYSGSLQQNTDNPFLLNF